MINVKRTTIFAEAVKQKRMRLETYNIFVIGTPM